MVTKEGREAAVAAQQAQTAKDDTKNAAIKSNIETATSNFRVPSADQQSYKYDIAGNPLPQKDSDTLTQQGNTHYTVNLEENLRMQEQQNFTREQQAKIENTQRTTYGTKTDYELSPEEWIKQVRGEGYTQVRVKTKEGSVDVALEKFDYKKYDDAIFTVSPKDPKIAEMKQNNIKMRQAEKDWLNEKRAEGYTSITIAEGDKWRQVPIDFAYREIVSASPNAVISVLPTLPENSAVVGTIDNFGFMENPREQKPEIPKDSFSKNLYALEKYNPNVGERGPLPNQGIVGTIKEGGSGAMVELGTTAAFFYNSLNLFAKNMLAPDKQITNAMSAKREEVYMPESLGNVVTGAAIQNALKPNFPQEMSNAIMPLIEKQGIVKTVGQGVGFAASFIPRGAIPIRFSKLEIPIAEGGSKVVYRGLALGYDESRAVIGRGEGGFIVGNPAKVPDKLALDQMVSRDRGVEIATGSTGLERSADKGGNKLLSKVLVSKETQKYLEERGLYNAEDKQLIEIGQSFEKNTRNLPAKKFREDFGDTPYSALDKETSAKDVGFITKEQNKPFWKFWDRPLTPQKGSGAEIPQLDPNAPSSSKLPQVGDKDFDDVSMKAAKKRAVNEAYTLQEGNTENVFLAESGNTGGKTYIAEIIKSESDLPSGGPNVFYHGGNLEDLSNIVKNKFDLKLAGKQTKAYLARKFKNEKRSDIESSKIIEKGVYLSDNPRTAWRFSQSAAASSGKQPAMLEILFKEKTKILTEAQIPKNVKAEALQYAEQTVSKNVGILQKQGADRAEILRAQNEGWKFYNKFLIRYGRNQGYDVFSHPISKTGVGNKELFVYNPKSIGNVKMIGKAGTEEKISEFLHADKNTPSDQIAYGKSVFGTKKDKRVVVLEGTKEHPEARGAKLHTLRSQIENYLSSTLAIQSKESTNTAKGAWGVGPATPRMKDVPKLYRAMETSIGILRSTGKTKQADILSKDLATYRNIWEKRGVDFEKYFSEHQQESSGFSKRSNGNAKSLVSAGSKGSIKISNTANWSGTTPNSKRNKSYSMASGYGSRSKSYKIDKIKSMSLSASSSKGSRGSMVGGYGSKGSKSSASSKSSKSALSSMRSMFSVGKSGTSKSGSRGSSGTSKSGLSFGSSGGSKTSGTSLSGSKGSLIDTSPSGSKLKTSKTDIVNLKILQPQNILKMKTAQNKRKYKPKIGYTKTFRWTVKNPFSKSFDILEGRRGKRLDK